MFSPKHCHELALKRIGRYLKDTATCGMVINPTRELSLDMLTPMLILQECMDMRILLTLLVLRVVRDL
jgi:hypothetical protein